MHTYTDARVSLQANIQGCHKRKAIIWVISEQQSERMPWWTETTLPVESTQCQGSPQIPRIGWCSMRDTAPLEEENLNKKTQQNFLANYFCCLLPWEGQVCTKNISTSNNPEQRSSTSEVLTTIWTYSPPGIISEVFISSTTIPSKRCSTTFSSFSFFKRNTLTWQKVTIPLLIPKISI